MGVGKYTPNAAIQGDMGWRLPALASCFRTSCKVYGGIPEDERTCLMCPDHLKNEAHILINCTFYDDLRSEIFQCAFRINSAFLELNLEEVLLCCIMPGDSANMRQNLL